MPARVPLSNAGPAETEILIVGGGLVGMAMAAALGGAGIPVTLVESEKLPDITAETFDGRSSAIAYGSQQVLSGIGAWDYIAAAAEPIRDIRVSDGGWQYREASPFFVHYHFADLNPDTVPGAHGAQPPFGWIIENRAVRVGLLKRLAEIAAVTHLPGTRVREIAFEGSFNVVTLDDGTLIRARLVIGADGRASAVRRMAGITTQELGYKHSAIVCTVTHDRPHDGVAHEHFLPVGPFAMLPMTDDAEGRHRSSIVWTEDPRIIPMLLALSDDELGGEIERRFGPTLGRIRPVGPRFNYPLKMILASTYIREGLALAGDAAHGMHPIAGQGFNMGVRDVAALSEVLVDAWRGGADLGSLAVLEHYARWRRFDNLMMLVVTDGLTRLFSNDIGPIRLARDIGFFLFNKAKPLKRLAMRHAMGIVGTLPRLVRGEKL
ncbi:UbiH/UbiF/VisC/COQ6 family ubiquinone biosynthesis hydroxylase [Dongia rigui]|uniref:UbiH/UbiF/VisC/COQ6 family ubiquinone biosynthesis hydroxylase n=1 Tax=Dongia rigui TaxID=940149 RepID=A0ABU5DW95_9PROT|nr:UbiH/UbiF/VisC/COQ6 family ubiquinone biosynthesis hydroxylase [Dongia rigui]MDY0871575.1 UbiH/UbiF/VisC/COQ6 family ubiquinone biosynthesis hydroxylase [Dongia rigui]